MTTQALSTYLNDHLAGAAAAVELLDHLIELHRGSDRRIFYETVQAEIIELYNSMMAEPFLLEFPMAIRVRCFSSPHNKRRV